MTFLNISRFSLVSIAFLIFFTTGVLSVYATGESVQIVSVSPTGTLSASSTVSFIASASGFVDPVYAVTDAFSAPGATVGTIDKIGYFTWTPTIYDAGKHSITVAVTDSQNHSASSTVTLRVGSSVVLVTSLSPGPLVAIGRTITFILNAPGFVTPSYGVYDTSSRSSISPRNVNSSGTFSWTPNNDDIGTHSLNILASDPYGNNAQTIQNITVVTPALSIKLPKPDSSVSVGSQVSFTVVPSMLVASTYTVSDSFTGTSTVTTSNISATGLFNWKPEEGDLGSHTLTVVATDTYGNTASTSVNMLVTPALATVSPITPAIVTPSASTTTPVSNSVVTSTVSKYVFIKNLAIGSQGMAVTELQKRLMALGFYTGPVSGYFGPMTSLAVKKFQVTHKLATVGIVGPATRAELNK
jgi:hypothetical protein